jgi:hypothetical protein
MDSRNTSGKLRFDGRIDRKTHDVSDLKNAYPDWDEMSDKEKLQATRNVEPVDQDTVYNVTTDELHKYFVRNLDPDDTSAEANVDVAWLGLGTDSAGGTSTSDTDINNRTYEETVTDVANNGKDLLASTFLDSTEGNGNTFDELGLFSGDPANLSSNEVFLINHATFSNVTKDNSKTVTFDVTLTFSDT